jgi:hypothetical protein
MPYSLEDEQRFSLIEMFIGKYFEKEMKSLKQALDRKPEDNRRFIPEQTEDFIKAKSLFNQLRESVKKKLPLVLK